MEYNQWDAFQDHPGWVKLVGLLTGRKDVLIGELRQVALVSTDPKVRALAAHLYAIDEVLAIPVIEKAHTQDAKPEPEEPPEASAEDVPEEYRV